MKTRTVQLGDVCERIDYGFTASADFSVKEPRLLRITDIQEGTVDWGHVPGCQICAEEEEDNRLEVGDIVFARTGATTGKSFLIRHVPPRAVFASYLIRLRASREILPEYLAAFCQSEVYWHQISGAVRGAAQGGVNSTTLSSLRLPLPSLSDQQRIAGQLEQADRLRRTRRYALELGDTFLPAAFLKLFGDLRETASRYDQMAFGDVVESNQLGLVRGAAEMRPDFPFDYLRMDAIVGDGSLDLGGLRRVKATPEEVREFDLQPGDFLFNTRNSQELVGKTALYSQRRGVVLFNNNIMRIRFKPSIRPEFMMGLFQSHWLKQNLERIKSGTTSVFAIYYKDLADLPIVVPPLPLQRQFAALVERVERLHSVQRESLRQSEHLFASLLHSAFTTA